MIDQETYRLCVLPVVERAKREVLADVKAGIVPRTVASYSELHDYVDANYYGGAFETSLSDDDGNMSEEVCEFWNAVQNAVHRWIREGGLLGAPVD